jgi:hypothetical protein
VSNKIRPRGSSAHRTARDRPDRRPRDREGDTLMPIVLFLATFFGLALLSKLTGVGQRKR